MPGSGSWDHTYFSCSTLLESRNVITGSGGVPSLSFLQLCVNPYRVVVVVVLRGWGWWGRCLDYSPWKLMPSYHRYCQNISHLTSSGSAICLCPPSQMYSSKDSPKHPSLQMEGGEALKLHCPIWQLLATYCSWGLEIQGSEMKCAVSLKYTSISKTLHEKKKNVKYLSQAMSITYWNQNLHALG